MKVELLGILKKEVNPALGCTGPTSVSFNGYFKYYGITYNIKSIDNFRYQVKRYLFKWLNRESQRRSYNWDKFQRFLNIYPLPKPKIYVNIFELDNKISYII